MVRSEKWNWDRILLFVIFILLLLDIGIHFVGNKSGDAQQEHEATNRSTKVLYLPALPIRFVHENPECTNKLLDAMNITNVHIGGSR